jgi:hypothetical protein
MEFWYEIPNDIEIWVIQQCEKFNLMEVEECQEVSFSHQLPVLNVNSF